LFSLFLWHFFLSFFGSVFLPLPFLFLSVFLSFFIYFMSPRNSPWSLVQKINLKMVRYGAQNKAEDAKRRAQSQANVPVVFVITREIRQPGQSAAILAVWGCIVPVCPYNTPMGHT
jgi:hypothetical protein